MIPPSEQPLSLAGKRAGFRDWSSMNPCTVQPRVLRDDFDAMSNLLEAWLKETGAGANGTWTVEQVALYEQGNQKLPEAITAQGKAVKASLSCPVDPKVDVAGAAKREQTFSEEAMARIAEGPAVLPVVKAKMEITKWKTAQIDALSTAKGEWCGAPGKPGAVPDIYYATEDELGTQEWDFCDDSKVVTASGGKPEFVAPITIVEAGKKPPRRADPKKYLEAATKWPPAEVQHAPKLPALMQPPAETPAVPDKGG